MPATTRQVWAVVPVKNLENAKQRLSPILEIGQRRSLLRAMLHDVLTALTDAECLAGVTLVTRDSEIRTIAQDFSVNVLVERDNSGHTAAVTRAARALAADNVAAMLTVPADLPLVTPADIAELIDAHAASPPAVTIAPARDKQGSNAMLCSPPDILPFRFGDNSFYPHLQRVRELGIEPRVVERTGLGLDIDTPDDLRVFAARRSATHAYDYLEQNGLINRLLLVKESSHPGPLPDETFAESPLPSGERVRVRGKNKRRTLTPNPSPRGRGE